jgi:hypothetical protein
LKNELIFAETIDGIVTWIPNAEFQLPYHTDRGVRHVYLSVEGSPYPSISIASTGSTDSQDAYDEKLLVSSSILIILILGSK